MMKKIVCAMAICAVCVCAVFSQIDSSRPDALRLHNEKEFARAIEVCEQELLENPQNIESYVVLCWSLISNRQYAEAEQRANQARALSWYEPRIVEALAEAKYYLGKNNESMALFHEYVSLIPDIAFSRTRLNRAYFLMGELYIKQTRYEHADIALSMAVHIDPNNEEYWTRLGYARELAHSYTKAVEAYNKALALNAASVDALRGKERSLARIR